ncbi:hypothetical protein L218DRAFT_1005021 [Marasmius fiardii PR-910]|nr:hypothetical protein L218DRAFT_1005021 [Marasmius fiardii PR-910]
MTEAALEKIVEALGHQQLISYMAVFSTTLLIYDIVINLHVEIDHIWMGKWSCMTVLYLLQRYLPFIDTAGLIIPYAFGASLSTGRCILEQQISSGLVTVGIGLSEVLLTVRVWAVWGRSTPVGIGLVVFFVASWGSLTIPLLQFSTSVRFVKPPFPMSQGCIIADGSRILFVAWVLLMVFDAGMLVMILIPGVAAYRKGGKSELVRMVYQDGRMNPSQTCNFN